MNSKSLQNLFEMIKIFSKVLHICAKRGLVEMLMRLVQAGADSKIRNNLGQLPEVSFAFRDFFMIYVFAV